MTNYVEIGDCSRLIMTNRAPYTRFSLFILLLLYAASLPCTAQVYVLKVIPAAGDSLQIGKLSIPGSFSSQGECLEYLSHLQQQLVKKGYLAASLDSIRIEPDFARIVLYTGNIYRWATLSRGDLPPGLLAGSGFNEKFFNGRLLDYDQVASTFGKILQYCENNGYPFARVKLGNIRIREGGVYAELILDKGFLFTIDSVAIKGNARISHEFAENYLGIHQGSPYDESRLQAISQHIAELSFLKEGKPWEIYFTGTKARLNLYLDIRKSNQFDFLIGFLPNSQATGRLLLTGQARLNLQNAFGHGEAISLNWQQLQYKSPQLDLGFQYPFLFNTPFGISLSFDLFRKDSSYLNIHEEAGLLYQLSATDYFKFYVQQTRSELLSVDTLAIKETHQLPPQLDISNTLFGIQYVMSHTDYRLNPTRGIEANISVGLGTKIIDKNNSILQLTASDTGSVPFNYGSLYDSLTLKSYQAKILVRVAKYFPLGGRSVLETALNGGALTGRNLLLNELFQIGGYALLRGFDEQSIYASQYAVLTLEYRYLLGLNSYFFLFSDNAYVHLSYLYGNTMDFPTGLGAGLAFQTKSGIFNISYAVGRSGGQAFHLNESKIHFGYMNFF
ncbi:MAG TPA: BamA/TamA family outer membrane protein [Chitinophagaceae bacterium]|nr:BamA/TamA family outer membrane protein [Chitinophagaceae bacterium]